MSFKIKYLLTLPLVLCTFLVLGQGRFNGEDIISNGLVSAMDVSFNNGAFVSQIGDNNSTEIQQSKSSGLGINFPSQGLSLFPGNNGDFPSQGIGEFPGMGNGLVQGLIPTIPFNLAAVNQMGNRNHAQVGQDGVGLITLVNQMGNANIASLNSSGNNVVQASNQMGRRNEISSDINFNGLGGTVALYNQMGRDNSIDVNVNTSFGYGIQPVLINQMGQGNQANVDVNTFSGLGNNIVISQTGGMTMNITQSPGIGISPFRTR